MWNQDSFPGPPESGPHNEGSGFYLKWIPRVVTPIFKFKWKTKQNKIPVLSNYLTSPPLKQVTKMLLIKLNTLLCQNNVQDIFKDELNKSRRGFWFFKKIIPSRTWRKFYWFSGFNIKQGIKPVSQDLPFKLNMPLFYTFSNFTNLRYESF